jgi:hypothetical protein
VPADLIGGLLTASFPFRCFPGSVTHGRCTRTRPALNARRTLRTARRVMRSAPGKPIPSSLSWTTSARICPFERSLHSSTFGKKGV